MSSLEIKVSAKMDEDSVNSGSISNVIIRVPKRYREKCGVALGEFIYLRRKDGDLEVLQVASSNECEAEDECMYVTSSTYNNLVIESTTVEDKIIHVENITLGCDPEVFIVDVGTGNLVNACGILNKHGDVGSDGMLLEFRPNPSTDVWQVCGNIQNLIAKARRIIDAKVPGNNYALLAASSWATSDAGFHLHYGMPRGLLNYDRRSNEMAAMMTAVFDFYVGILSIIPECNKDISRRTKTFCRYGKPGNFRLDSRTFEYRLPGGINMASPLLASGLMSVGAVVAEDVASRISTCTDNFSNLYEILENGTINELYPNLPSLQEMFSIICNPNISYARSFLDRISNDIRMMVGYKRRDQDIERYLNVLYNYKDLGNNIEETWGLK